MNFQGLSKVEKADWYLDLAFRNAAKVSRDLKGQKKAGPDTIRKAEQAKIRSVQRTLVRHFDIILKSFPSLDGMTEFYQEMVRAMLDFAELKKSLGAVRWAEQKVVFFSDLYWKRIGKCADFRKMTGYAREYYGRIGSVVKQVRKQLDYLEESRKAMQEFPSIKKDMFTVCLAGFPNVGKTTLLSELTGSTPEIANYAFTTRRLNVGYANIGNRKVQFIDTPGALDRFEKMNPIEKQAYLSMKYCADLIVFVFDTGDQAYSNDKQKKLLAAIRLLGKDVVVYFSKTDILVGKTADEFISENFKRVEISKKFYKTKKDLKEFIAQFMDGFES